VRPRDAHPPLPLPTSDVRKLAFDAAPCGLFLCDADGRFLAANAAFERLTGYEVRELTGSLTLSDVLDPKQFAIRGTELLGGEQADGLPLVNLTRQAAADSELEWTCVRRDQSRVDVLLGLAPIASPAGGVTGYSGWMADNSQRAWQQNQLWYRSHHDALTELPNQALLLEHLEISLQHRRQRDEPIRLAVIEVDNLRVVLDSLGQDAADATARTVAARLRGHLARGEHLAAVETGQFALVSVGETRMDAQSESDLLALICAPIAFASTTIRPNASIGIASFPDAGQDAATLLHRARLALSAARQDGSGVARHFEYDMQTSSSKRHVLELMLRRAIDDEELSLNFQPQINLKTGNILLAEALLRWKHPDRGNISPADFIPIAESTGLILPIGEWVIRQACRQAVRILTRYGDCPRIAVNVSPVQFRRQDVLGIVRRELEAAQLDPRFLEVEITEGVLLNDTEKSIATLQGLRELGVEIAIDDFGTGYSSLSYLTRFKVDRIKIDRSLVVAMMGSTHGTAIVSAILAMAHALDVHVTAEGVETEEQANVLKELGCDEIQGFWFSRPLTSQAFEHILAPWDSTNSH
jgi:diguanylate cyclase (GGDEF)-like protein